jgi:hypothetical protein
MKSRTETRDGARHFGVVDDKKAKRRALEAAV